MEMRYFPALTHGNFGHRLQAPFAPEQQLLDNHVHPEQLW